MRPPVTTLRRRTICGGPARTRKRLRSESIAIGSPPSAETLGKPRQQLAQEFLGQSQPIEQRPRRVGSVPLAFQQPSGQCPPTSVGELIDSGYILWYPSSELHGESNQNVDEIKMSTNQSVAREWAATPVLEQHSTHPLHERQRSRSEQGATAL